MLECFPLLVLPHNSVQLCWRPHLPCFSCWFWTWEGHDIYSSDGDCNQVGRDTQFSITWTLSISSDIHALGAVISELFGGKAIWEIMLSHTIILNVAIKGIMPNIWSLVSIYKRYSKRMPLSLRDTLYCRLCVNLSSKSLTPQIHLEKSIIHPGYSLRTWYSSISDIYNYNLVIYNLESCCFHSHQFNDLIERMAVH